MLSADKEGTLAEVKLRIPSTDEYSYTQIDNCRYIASCVKWGPYGQD